MGHGQTRIWYLEESALDPCARMNLQGGRTTVPSPSAFGANQDGAATDDVSVESPKHLNALLGFDQARDDASPFLDNDPPTGLQPARGLQAGHDNVLNNDGLVALGT